MAGATAEYILRLGVALNRLREDVLEHTRDLELLEQQIGEREVNLIPEGGWPGSNDAARKAARDRCYATDPQLVAFRASLSGMRDQHARLTLRLQQIETDLRVVELGLHAEALARSADLDPGLGEALDGFYALYDEHDALVQAETDYQAEVDRHDALVAQSSDDLDPPF